MKRQEYFAGRESPLTALLDGAARVGWQLGGLVFLAVVGICVWTFFSLNPQGDAVAQALRNVETYRMIGVFAGLAAAVGAAIFFWGEEILGPILLLLGGLLFFAPTYLPLIGEPQNAEVGMRVLSAFQVMAIPFGLLGLLAVTIDVIGRVRDRSEKGSKADQMKYGKDVKEELDTQNVFLGKCWQMPFCRKFIREKCPIYHARRTCWKERVGCMCEESVIKNAMSGTQTIPKESVAAAKFIPYNHRLLPQQKAERCRQCIIYNERQRQKYKLFLPVTLISVIGFTALFWNPLVRGMSNLMTRVEGIYASATLREDASVIPETTTIPFTEILLVLCVFLALAYALRLLEYLIFGLKI